MVLLLVLWIEIGYYLSKIIEKYRCNLVITPRTNTSLFVVPDLFWHRLVVDDKTPKCWRKALKGSDRWRVRTVEKELNDKIKNGQKPSESFKDYQKNGLVILLRTAVKN